jgi:hypothetical protein
LTDAWQAPDTSRPPAFQPLHGLTLGVTLVVGLGALCNLLMTVSSLALAPMEAQGDPNATLVVALVVGGSGLTMLAAMLCGLPLWVIWHVRAANNLLLLGERLEFTPTMHAAWWFVPFANLVMPYRAMRELLARSRPLDAPEVETPLLGVWWACWIGGNLLADLSAQLDAVEPGVGTSLALLSLPITLGAAWLYLSYLRQIERDQGERFARMAA